MVAVDLYFGGLWLQFRRQRAGQDADLGQPGIALDAGGADAADAHEVRPVLPRGQGEGRGLGAGVEHHGAEVLPGGDFYVPGCGLGVAGGQGQLWCGFVPGAARQGGQLGGGGQRGDGGLAFGGEPGALAGIDRGGAALVAGRHLAAQYLDGAAFVFGVHPEVRAAHGGVAGWGANVERPRAFARGVGFDATVSQQKAGVEVLLAVVGAQALQPHLGGRGNAQAGAVGQGDQGGTVGTRFHGGALGQMVAIVGGLAVDLHLVGGGFERGPFGVWLQPAGQQPKRGAGLQAAGTRDVVELLHVMPAFGRIEKVLRQAQQRVAGLDGIENFAVAARAGVRAGGGCTASRRVGTGVGCATSRSALAGGCGGAGRRGRGRMGRCAGCGCNQGRRVVPGVEGYLGRAGDAHRGGQITQRRQQQGACTLSHSLSAAAAAWPVHHGK